MALAAFRLPDKLIHKVDEISREVQRPRSYLIRKALETYVEEYMDYHIALGRLRDKDDTILSGKEMRKRVGK